jgi:hypothetical protein
MALMVCDRVESITARLLLIGAGINIPQIGVLLSTMLNESS